MPIKDQISALLRSASIDIFGISMPILSGNWTNQDTGMPQIMEKELALTLPEPLPNTPAIEWVAPLAGIAQKIDPADSSSLYSFRTTMNKPSGEFLKEKGILLTIFPTVYLRLSRLYIHLLESDEALNLDPVAQAAQAQGVAIRPVPRYFFYSGDPEFGVSGRLYSGDEMNMGQKMTVYDQQGFPIDPLAVASIFSAILKEYSILKKRPLGTPPVVDDMQISRIANLEIEEGANKIRIWITTPGGTPYSGEHLIGLTPSEPKADGVFFADSNASSIQIAPVSEEYLEEERKGLWIGPTTSGILGDTFTLPPLPGRIILPRDHFNLMAVSLNTYLLGEIPFPQKKYRINPVIRTNETLEFLVDGNDILGAISTCLSGEPGESLVVAPRFSDRFPMPEEKGLNAHWPFFPMQTGVGGLDDSPLPVNLRDQVESTAILFNHQDPGKANTDVVLTLNNLPAGAAVRVYHRKLEGVFEQERGDGAGGIVDAWGRVQLYLKDPLGLRTEGIPESALKVPPDALLIYDLVVVRRGNAKARRIYGAMQTPINSTVPTTVDPTPSLPNLLSMASRKGHSLAGIIGLKSPNCGLSPDFLESILCLTGEGEVRDASRFPTMSRRDTVISGLKENGWKSVLSAGRLEPEMIAADSRLGAPGSLGGREVQSTGIFTESGLLAYDMARSALRRTQNLFERIKTLRDTKWSEPASITGTSGNFAGAVLQTISPTCETPELSLLPNSIWDTLPDSLKRLLNALKKEIGELIPADFLDRMAILEQINTSIEGILANENDLPEPPEKWLRELKRRVTDLIPSDTDLRNQVHGKIDEVGAKIRDASKLFFGFLEELKNEIDKLIPSNLPFRRDILNWINSKIDEIIEDAGITDENLDRIYKEFKRELALSWYGKRDAQWALKQAIKQARHFIYIESPSFASTKKDYAGALRKRLDKVDENAKSYILQVDKEKTDVVDQVRGKIDAAYLKWKETPNDLQEHLETLKEEIRGIILMASFPSGDEIMSQISSDIDRIIQFEGLVPFPSEPFHEDLIELIKNRISEISGLHVVICTPKFLDYARAYKPFAEMEARDRYDKIRELNDDRVVSFHPIGFPGRYTIIESTTVIVDDVWGMIGSSAFRRRGLGFDGGSDLVFTDKQRIDGRSPAISDLRRRLLAIRLGISPEGESSFGIMRNSSYIRLKDGIESFYLIREMLVAGGIGKIARLYNPPAPESIEELTIDLTNPDGMEFSYVYSSALLTALLAGLNSY